MAYSAHTVNYNIIRGLPWERLIIVKDRRTHRLLKPTEARAFLKTGTLSKKELTVEVTSEQGIMLSLTSEETQDLPLGELVYDVLATIGEVQRPVAKGTIVVSALDNITPWEDSQAMEIRFKQRVDFRRTFTWKDADGEILTVQNAYMQAKDTAGVTVLDLRWYSSTPSEATVIALPVERRGYLAPIAGSTLEMHISDKNTVAAGSYNFDLFVQDSAGDWDCLASGTVVVEAAISAPPT
jgi:hypothetical protein